MTVRVKHDLVLVDGSGIAAGEILTVHDIRTVTASEGKNVYRYFVRRNGKIVQLKPGDVDVIE